MKKILLVSAIATAIIILVLIIFRTKVRNENKMPQSLTQTQQLGEVEVTVTPILRTSKNTLDFDLTFNTHSVELDLDLLQITSLTDDQGRQFSPLAWTGGRGGHHLEGTLSFTKLPPTTKEVTMILVGIDDQTAKFSWETNSKGIIESTSERR